jgi:L-asparaginase
MLLGSLQLRGVDIDRVSLMNKDSLEMSDADHDLITTTAAHFAATHAGVVIAHGTDRLAKTGNRIHAKTPEPLVPIVLTGAMLPWVMRTTDAQQNIIEALLAVQVLPPGVYCVMHNNVLQFPGVEKDAKAGTFVKRAESAERPKS